MKLGTFILLVFTFNTFLFGTNNLGLNSSDKRIGIPIIELIRVESVMSDSVWLCTYYIPNGHLVTLWFEWGPTSQYGNISNVYHYDTVYDTSMSSLWFLLSPLEANTLYHFRAFIKNENGTASSNDSIVITAPTKIKDFSAVLLTAFSVRFVGSCNPKGNPTEVFFQWKPTLAFAWKSTIPIYIGGDTSLVSFSDSIVGLVPDVSYLYRCISRNKEIPELFSKSMTKTFVTLSDPNSGGFTIDINMKCPMFNGTKNRKFGIHTHATYCLDEEFGEALLPPAPPSGVFDLRFVDIRSGTAACMENGMYLDMRKYVNSAQQDTYKLKFQPGNCSYPLTFSWQPLKANYTGDVKLVLPLNGNLINVDMKSQTSYDLYDDGLAYLYILAQGPKNAIWSKANLIAPDSVLLVGKFNPNGQFSEGWFEWGLTSDYGAVSSKHNLGDIQENVFFSELIDSLQPYSKYYFRAVTQNSEGICYGNDNSFTTSTQVNVKEANAGSNNFYLYQNYPNPFNPTTTVSYQLPNDNFVTLKIYDILGQEVATLVDESKKAGYYKEVWDASNYSSGVYFYQLSSRDNKGITTIARGKLILLK
jgi:hypothetical protein